LRVQDVDSERLEFMVRDGPCAKARVTTMPNSFRAPLQAQLAGAERTHEVQVVACPTERDARHDFRHSFATHPLEDGQDT
jgi:site-specific recombinase XerD